MTRTEDLFYTLDRWVFEQETSGVPLIEIVDCLKEYIDILEDLDAA